MLQRSGTPRLIWLSMTTISVPLTKEQFAIIDSSDIDFVSHNFWYLTSDNRYAAARINNRIVLMHRHILELDDGDEECDHIDGDGLNNRRSNLRKVSHTENMWNTARHRFKVGISVDTTNKRWKVYIDEIGHPRVNIGTVQSRERAEDLLSQATSLRRNIEEFDDFREACLKLRPPRSNARTKICETDSCNRLAKCRGMCNLHYQQWYHKTR